MPAGRYSDRIAVHRLVAGDDGYGNTVAGWDDSWLSVWADMLETPGREVVQAGRIEAPRTATIRIMQSPATEAITAADRILARGRLWNIRSIAPIGRKGDVLELLCEAEVAA